MQASNPIYDLSALPAQLSATDADSAVPISYPDIYVWICNKNLSKISHLIKTIWDGTPGGDLLEQKTLNDFVREYTRFLTEKFRKYKRKLRFAQQFVLSLTECTMVARDMQGAAGELDRERRRQGIRPCRGQV